MILGGGPPPNEVHPYMRNRGRRCVAIPKGFPTLKCKESLDSHLINATNVQRTESLEASKSSSDVLVGKASKYTKVRLYP